MGTVEAFEPIADPIVLPFFEAFALATVLKSHRLDRKMAVALLKTIRAGLALDAACVLVLTAWGVLMLTD